MLKRDHSPRGRDARGGKPRVASAGRLDVQPLAHGLSPSFAIPIGMMQSCHPVAVEGVAVMSVLVDR